MSKNTKFLKFKIYTKVASLSVKLTCWQISLETYLEDLENLNEEIMFYLKI